MKGALVMQYPVIIEQLNGHYRATIPSLMNLMAEGNSRDEAIQNVKQAAEMYLAKIEITTIDVTAPPQSLRPDSPQSWLRAAGKFKGEEAEMQQHIKEIYEARKRQRDEANQAEAELIETQ